MGRMTRFAENTIHHWNTHAPSSSHFIHGKVHMSADIHHRSTPPIIILNPCFFFSIVPGFRYCQRERERRGVGCAMPPPFFISVLHTWCILIGTDIYHSLSENRKRYMTWSIIRYTYVLWFLHFLYPSKTPVPWTNYSTAFTSLVAWCISWPSHAGEAHPFLFFESCWFWKVHLIQGLNIHCHYTLFINGYTTCTLLSIRSG